MSVFQMGDNTYPIPMTLYKANRSKVVEELKKEKRLSANGGVVLLQGGNDISHYDTDVDYVFRQVSHFFFVYSKPLLLIA
jgi:Xaa-Pro dipeptidase